MKKGVIFDLDGTLWNASMQVVPAWNIVLNKYNDLKVRQKWNNKLQGEWVIKYA